MTTNDPLGRPLVVLPPVVTLPPKRVHPFGWPGHRPVDPTNDRHTCAKCGETGIDDWQAHIAEASTREHEA